ncbi:MAG: crotonase/enoyl-CoA hydratase family protein [Acidimicrobiales bacterium]
MWTTNIVPVMVDYERHGPIAVITVNRPEARNAINGEVAEGIEAAIDRVEGDDEVWVGVVGHVGPVFSAGADLKEIAAGNAARLSTERGGFAGLVRRERTKPLIAAVDGPALAGGCEVVLACDLTVASTAASFGLPEVSRSLVAAAGGLFRLPRTLPLAVAQQVVLTGQPISAERAWQLGMVNELCEPGQARAAAVDLAERVCANAPVAVRLSRQVLLGSLGQGDDEGWRLTADAFRTVARTEDFHEGPRAFIEKRPPTWLGR